MVRNDRRDGWWAAPQCAFSCFLGVAKRHDPLVRDSRLTGHLDGLPEAAGDGRCHSYLRATRGSTRVARRAGMYVASIATRAITIGTIT